MKFQLLTLIPLAVTAFATVLPLGNGHEVAFSYNFASNDNRLIRDIERLAEETKELRRNIQKLNENQIQRVAPEVREDFRNLLNTMLKSIVDIHGQYKGQEANQIWQHYHKFTEESIECFEELEKKHQVYNQGRGQIYKQPQLAVLRALMGAWEPYSYTLMEVVPEKRNDMKKVTEEFSEKLMEVMRSFQQGQGGGDDDRDRD